MKRTKQFLWPMTWVCNCYLGAMVISALAGCTSSAMGAVAYTNVILSDSSVPGFPGNISFQQFSVPILNNTGLVSFSSEIPEGTGGVDASNSFGYWIASEAGVEMLFRTGNPAPGLQEGSVYSAVPLFSHTVDDSGRVGFAWRVIDAGSASAGGVWSGTSLGLKLLAFDGSTAPGLPSSVRSFKFDLTPVVTYQTNGGTVLLGSADNGSVSYSQVLWRGQSENLSVVARSLGAAPGFSENVVFDQISNLAVSTSGRVAFQANVFETSGSKELTEVNDSGLWSDGSGFLKLAVREGQLAPGAFGGRFARFEQPSINQSGHIAFRGTLATAPGIDPSNNEAIWAEEPGGLQLVAREGFTAPGTLGAVFDGLSDPRIGIAQKAAFGAKLRTGTGAVDELNDTGLWGSLSGSLELIAREGEQAPGLPSGVCFGNIAFADAWTANESGALAFFVDLIGPGVTSLNDVSLWAQRPDGMLALIAREGEVFNVAPGDTRLIRNISFATGTDLHASSLADGWNDAFELAFRLQFNDGTEGLFVANVPEAGTCAMLLAGGMLLAGRSRRFRLF